MNDSLKEILDDYINEFLNQDHVKKYFLLEEQINSSQEIKDLQAKLKKSQKSLALSINNKDLHQIKLKEYLQAKDDLYLHPLVNNYLSIKEEILSQLKSLETKLNSKTPKN